MNDVAGPGWGLYDAVGPAQGASGYRVFFKGTTHVDVSIHNHATGTVVFWLTSYIVIGWLGSETKQLSGNVFESDFLNDFCILIIVCS